MAGRVVPKAKGVKKAPVKRAAKGVTKVPAKKAAPARAKSSTAYHGPREPTVVSDLAAAAVDELPPDGNSGNRRTLRYLHVTREIRGDARLAGKWVPAVEYIGRDGATTAKRELEAGHRAVDGELSDWEFQARRTDSGGSVLYVKLVGS